MALSFLNVKTVNCPSVIENIVYILHVILYPEHILNPQYTISIPYRQVQ